jgi:REP element-mobilizing transposase RayT
MAGTFSKIYIQIVFAVKYRQKLFQLPWRIEVFKYISGIISNKNQKPIIVNGVDDHIHILVGMKSSLSISDLVRDVKNNSTNFINERKWMPNKFNWQEGYGAFSYSPRDIDSVYNYILNQEEHHRKKSFQEEYLSVLKEYEIEFDEKFLFDGND